MTSNSNGPWLSIITPVWNKATYIESCLRNVADQKCQGVEHIVADNLSTDGTREIVEAFAETHPEVRVYSERDSGQSDAMNKAISRARGSVLGILNADDFYEPGTFDHVKRLMSDAPVPTLLVGDYAVWDSNGRRTGVYRPRRLSYLNILLGRSFAANPSSYFYHRVLHDSIGPYDVAEHFAMDLIFLIAATRVAHVRYEPILFGNFRLVEGTKTTSDMQAGKAEQRFRDILRRHQDELPLAQRMAVRAGYRAYRRFAPPLVRVLNSVRAHVGHR